MCSYADITHPGFVFPPILSTYHAPGIVLGIQDAFKNRQVSFLPAIMVISFFRHDFFC